MGRIRKYFTKKQQKEAQRKWQMEHYERNKDVLRKVARDRYRKKRQEEISEERRKLLYGE
jgi:ribosomal protein S17E